MTTKIYKLVTRLTTSSVYGSEIAVLQTKWLDMSQSMLTTQFSIINPKLCGKFLLAYKITLHSRLHFLMAELFFGAKIIACHRFNTDGRLQHFVMLLQKYCKKF
jgi:hypothetical protein